MPTPKGTDSWRLSPVDAPDKPSKGMRFWVQFGDHWAIGENYSISRVNSKSFYVANRGGSLRLDLDRWFHWLVERQAEGFVVLDGHPMRPPRGAALAAGLPRVADCREEDIVRIDLRDARLLRAVKTVLTSYELAAGPSTADKLDTINVTNGKRRYVVHVDPAWERPPRCSCPDAVRVEDEAGATFCKHTIAVLLSRPDHRHQLIDLLL